MNINTARKLQERRYRASPVVTTGELINLIGNDGLQEALNRRWIVPDQDTGFLTLNFNGGKLVELESACRCQCGKTDCACPEVNEGAASTVMPMREAFAGFGLPMPSSTPTNPPAAVSVPRTPATPTAPAAPGQASPQIGDDAVVTEDGKTFTGKVASVSQDGRYRMSFGGTKPNMDRDYGPNELRTLQADQTPNA